MTLLSKDQILGSTNRNYREVEVPEWGGPIRLSVMTSSERDAFESSLLEKDKKRGFQNLRARLVALCVVDEDGKRVFADADVAKLGEQPADVIGRLFDECRDINGFNKETDDLEGN